MKKLGGNILPIITLSAVIGAGVFLYNPSRSAININGYQIIRYDNSTIIRHSKDDDGNFAPVSIELIDNNNNGTIDEKKTYIMMSSGGLSGIAKITAKDQKLYQELLAQTRFPSRR